jgi:hypothetical protein
MYTLTDIYLHIHTHTYTHIHTQDYIAVSAKIIATLDDPHAFAQKLEEWDIDQPGFKDAQLEDLYKKFEEGDQASAEQLMQVFADRELGGCE